MIVRHITLEILTVTYGIHVMKRLAHGHLIYSRFILERTLQAFSIQLTIPSPTITPLTFDPSILVGHTILTQWRHHTAQSRSPSSASAVSLLEKLIILTIYGKWFPKGAMLGLKSRRPGSIGQDLTMQTRRDWVPYVPPSVQILCCRALILTVGTDACPCRLFPRA